MTKTPEIDSPKYYLLSQKDALESGLTIYDGQSLVCSPGGYGNGPVYYRLNSDGKVVECFCFVGDKILEVEPPSEEEGEVESQFESLVSCQKPSPENDCVSAEQTPESLRPIVKQRQDDTKDLIGKDRIHAPVEGQAPKTRSCGDIR